MSAANCIVCLKRPNPCVATTLEFCAINCAALSKLPVSPPSELTPIPALEATSANVSLNPTPVFAN